MSRERRPSRSESVSRLGDAKAGGMFDPPSDEESLPYGCSMLSHIRLQPRNPKAFVPMRCALGYALRGDDSIAKCLAVEGPAECWKSVQNWRISPPEAWQGTSSPVDDAGTTHPVESNGVAPEAAVSDTVVQVAVEHTVEVIEVVQTRTTSIRHTRRRKSR